MNSDGFTATAAPARGSAILAQSRPAVRGGAALVRLAWALLGATYAVLILALLWPADFRNESSLRILADWTMFLVRTFDFHIGIAALVAAAAAVVLRFR